MAKLDPPDLSKAFKALNDDLAKIRTRRAGGTVSLIRSDLRAAMRKHGITPDDKQVRQMADEIAALPKS